MSGYALFHPHWRPHSRRLSLAQWEVFKGEISEIDLASIDGGKRVRVSRYAEIWKLEDNRKAQAQLTTPESVDALAPTQGWGGAEMNLPDGLRYEGGTMHFPRPAIALENKSEGGEPGPGNSTFITVLIDGEWKYLGLVRKHVASGDGWHYLITDNYPVPCPTALYGINTILRSAGVIP